MKKHPELNWLEKQLPPVETIWRRSEADFYGASYVIAQQIGKKKPPVSFAAWRHGWFFSKSVVHPCFLAKGTRRTLNLMGTQRQVRILKEYGYNNAVAVGLPYIYADTLELERKPGSLLVMPAHTLPYNKQHWDQNAYVAEIVKLKPYFSSIVACIHGACVEHGYWIHEFERHGIPWVQGADSYDKNALRRMNVMFKSFEYMTTNSLGSHVAYAAYSGAKVSVFGPYAAPEIDNFSNDPFYKKYPELLRTYVENLQEDILKCHYPDLFSTPMEAIERRAWGAEMVGAAYRKDPQKIAALLGWSIANQIIGYCKEGLRLACSPSALRNLFERRRIAKQP
jgi:hypothetical protein